jgi:YebC/PmpR family DNA-binding regulatory protein
MSGHSKWSQIKRQKAAADKKRGNLFTKLSNTITLAAKQGGGDPNMNFKLRLALDKAKAANMPNDTIERAIKKGTGELAGQSIEETTYEGFGPGGVALIIEATTDNKNRTTASLRRIFNTYNGNLGTDGSVQWMFKHQGVIRVAAEQVTDRDALELNLIDAGAQDIVNETEGMTIYTAPQQLAAVKKVLDERGIATASAELEFVPQEKIAVAKSAQQATLNKLFEALEEDEDITNYYTNAELSA